MPKTEIPSERVSKIKKLVIAMNKQNLRFFPPTRPMIEAMNVVLSDEELDYLLLLGPGHYTYEEAARVSKMPEEQFKPIFDSLKIKGFIHISYDENGNEIYRINAILVGWIEAQVPFLMGKPEAVEFAKNFHDEYAGIMRKYNLPLIRNLHNLVLRKVFKANQSIGINTLPLGKKGKEIEVNQPVSISDSIIYPTRTVNDLIDEYGSKNQIGVIPCMCRYMTGVLDDPCRTKIPDKVGCIGIGSLIKPYIQHGHARPVSKEEVIDLIQIGRDNGAIHTVYHERDDLNLPEVGICNCCWDCCGFLRGYNRGAVPVKYQCYYSAQFKDASSCNGCGKCNKFCPTDAIPIEDKMASIKTKKCIGCGQCVYQCPQGILELTPNERVVFLPIIKKSETRIKN